MSGHVDDGLATKANQVMMGRGIGLKPRGSMMRTDFLNQSMLFKGLQILIYRGEGYGWDLPFHHVVYRFRTGMTVHGGERLEDDLPLMGDGQAMPLA